MYVVRCCGIYCAVVMHLREVFRNNQRTTHEHHQRALNVSGVHCEVVDRRDFSEVKNLGVSFKITDPSRVRRREQVFFAFTNELRQIFVGECARISRNIDRRGASQCIPADTVPCRFRIGCGYPVYLGAWNRSESPLMIAFSTPSAIASGIISLDNVS